MDCDSRPSAGRISAPDHARASFRLSRIELHCTNGERALDPESDLSESFVVDGAAGIEQTRSEHSHASLSSQCNPLDSAYCTVLYCMRYSLSCSLHRPHQVASGSPDREVGEAEPQLSPSKRPLHPQPAQHNRRSLRKVGAARALRPLSVSFVRQVETNARTPSALLCDRPDLPTVTKSKSRHRR